MLRIDVEIEKIVQGGLGMGRAGKVVVFVPRSAPGDRLKVLVPVQHRNYWEGVIEDVLEPSPLRVSPECPYYGVCGGCDLQHLNYEAQLETKKQIVNETLQRIGGVSPVQQSVVAAPSRWRYRNKSQYPVSGPPWRVGYFERHTHNVKDIGFCLVQPEAFDRLRADLKARLERSEETAYDEVSGLGNLRHIILRQGAATGEMMLVLVGAGKPGQRRRFGVDPSLYENLAEHHPQLVSTVYNLNPHRTNRILGRTFDVIAGSASYTDSLLGLRLRVSAGSFFQANTAAAELLVRCVIDALGGSRRGHVLDLFCGVGTFTLPVASRATKVTGIEASPEAVADARASAEANNIGNVEVIAAPAERAIGTFDGIDSVILDPPRKGCSPELLRNISALKPETIIYVSCNPATLARDLGILRQHGYEPDRVQLVDMFPQTSHIETVTRIVPARPAQASCP